MNWRAIIKLYKTQYYPSGAEEQAWFANQPSLAGALRCAATATREDGKRFSHQRRVPRTALQRACDELMRREQRIAACTTFDEIVGTVRSVASNIPGLGPLYVYDTALRIGGKLRIYPDKVYLHCGTRVGARRFGFPSKGEWLEMRDLPKPLRVLPAAEVEDILCIFKDGWSRRPAGRCSRGSACDTEPRPRR
jgi:hypothetical protein